MWMPSEGSGTLEKWHVQALKNFCYWKFALTCFDRKKIERPSIFLRSLDEEAILTCFLAAAFLHKSNCSGFFFPFPPSLYFMPLSRIIYFLLFFNEIREIFTRFLYHGT